MTFSVTTLYAVIFTIIALVLSNVVSALRGRYKVSILHGDNMHLALWIRRHGNLAETLPLALILMGLCEVRGLGVTWLHVMGVVLIIGRAMHVAGLSATSVNAPLRIAGASLSQLAMLAAALYLGWTLF